LSHHYCYLPLSWKRWNWFECAVGGVRLRPRGDRDRQIRSVLLINNLIIMKCHTFTLHVDSLGILLAYMMEEVISIFGVKIAVSNESFSYFSQPPCLRLPYMSLIVKEWLSQSHSRWKLSIIIELDNQGT
jgi:hypothetical protein